MRIVSPSETSMGGKQSESPNEAMSLFATVRSDGGTQRVSAFPPR